MNKKTILLVSIAAIGTLAAVLAMQNLRQDRPSTEGAQAGQLEAQPQAIAETTTRDKDEVAEVWGERDQNLERAVANGFVNVDLVDYAAMGEDDPLFQERFFVLTRHNASSEEGCSKVALDEQSHTCWNDYNFQPHFSYDVETLRQLANNDPIAAAVLALKLDLSNADEALFYRLRAAQLSGKPGPLVNYLRTNGTVVDDSSGQLLNVEQVLQQYAIALVVDAMGYPYVQATEQLARLNRYGVPGDLQDQAQADSQHLLAQLGEAK